MVIRKHILARTLIILVLCLSVFQVVWARTVEVKWQTPYNLSHSPTASIYPSIVTDRYGYVHVFWAEDFEGKSVDPENPLEKSNSIMYSFWDGSTWSEPINLFYYVSGEAYNFPYATIDDYDRLYLAWHGFNGIYYSSVNLRDARWVKAWRSPMLIARSRGDGPRIFVDSQGWIHVVYSAWESATTGLSDGNVYYVNSTDGGNTWSDPWQLSRIPNTVSVNSSHSTIIMDKQGVLHVVWYEAEPPTWTGSYVYYVRSEDGGVSWSEPFEIWRRAKNDNWASMPDIVSLGTNELHVVWVCGEQAYRCHRWSKDGGKTWSAVKNKVFGEMLSLAGWDTLAVDGDGQLYWILQLRLPVAIYYSYWTGDEWSDLQIVNDDILRGGHYLRAASHDGNRLDLVVVDQGAKEIWYMQGITNSNPIDPLPLLAAMQRTPEPGVTPTPQPTRVQFSPRATIPVSTSPGFSSINHDPGLILGLSLAPVALLVIGVIFVRRRLYR